MTDVQASYALAEVPKLLCQLTSRHPGSDPIARYLCALFSELAYYHIPQIEIDDKKRAKLIPCDAYGPLIEVATTAVGIGRVLADLEFEDVFFAETDAVVAIGAQTNDTLFLAFRGTKVLYDWPINLDIRSARTGCCCCGHHFFRSGHCGKVHRGFLRETYRIAEILKEKVGPQRYPRHTLLTGHSLGGAIATIAADFFDGPRLSVCTFGAPRFAGLMADRPRFYPATHVCRPGDAVPMVPPRLLGYDDPAYQIGITGVPIPRKRGVNQMLSEIKTWLAFAATFTKSHSIESYRRDLGTFSRIDSAEWPLTSFEKVTGGDVQ